MKKKVIFSMCLVVLLSTIGLVGCNDNDRISLKNKEKIEKMEMPLGKDENIELEVYFDASTDKGVKVLKVERLIHKEELIGELIVQELIKGPDVIGEVKPVLPKETRLLSFSIKNGIAIVNLSNEAKVNMSPEKEEACLKSIVYSITQLPSVVKVKILIENKVSTLGGNFDLTNPLTREGISEARINK